jgi:hypothetical protein
MDRCDSAAPRRNIQEAAAAAQQPGNGGVPSPGQSSGLLGNGMAFSAYLGQGIIQSGR